MCLCADTILIFRITQCSSYSIFVQALRYSFRNAIPLKLLLSSSSLLPFALHNRTQTHTANSNSSMQVNNQGLLESQSSESGFESLFVTVSKIGHFRSIATRDGIKSKLSTHLNYMQSTTGKTPCKYTVDYF